MLPELTTYSVVRLRISILCGVGEIVRLSVSFAEESINFDFQVWDIPCIARVMVRITLSGGVSNLSQRAGWNNF